MGTDIYCTAEKRIRGKWHVVDYSCFDWRSYRIYSFLADVRNRDEIPCIVQPRGFPKDMKTDKDYEKSSRSWLLISEMVEYDYDQDILLKSGQKITVREYLGSDYFDELSRLKQLGCDRIVFYFIS